MKTLPKTGRIMLRLGFVKKSEIKLQHSVYMTAWGTEAVSIVLSILVLSSVELRQMLIGGIFMTSLNPRLRQLLKHKPKQSQWVSNRLGVWVEVEYGSGCG